MIISSKEKKKSCDRNVLMKTIRPCWTKSSVLASGQSDHVVPSSLIEYLSAPAVWPRSGTVCDNCSLPGFIALCEMRLQRSLLQSKSGTVLPEWKCKKGGKYWQNKRSLYNNHYIISDTIIQIILGLNFFCVLGQESSVPTADGSFLQ